MPDFSTTESVSSPKMTSLNSPTSPDWKLNDLAWENPTLYVQFVITIVGILGNILVIIAHFMGDLFNAVVNDFVFSLACTDLLAAILLLPIPGFEEMPPSPLGRVYCIFLQGDVSTLLWICITTSVLLTMMISIESFTAVRKPKLHKKMFCFKRYRRLISLIAWLVSVLMNTRHYVTKRVDENGTCHDTLHDKSEHTCGIVVSLPIGLTYILPSIVMMASYLFTSPRLHKNLEKGDRRNSALLHARHRVIGNVLINVIVLISCMALSHVIFLLRCLDKTKNEEYLHTLTHFETILLSLYVCSKPIIYAITNHQFRLTLKNMRDRLIWCCRCTR